MANELNLQSMSKDELLNLAKLAIPFKAQQKGLRVNQLEKLRRYETYLDRKFESTWPCF